MSFNLGAVIRGIVCLNVELYGRRGNEMAESFSPAVEAENTNYFHGLLPVCDPSDSSQYTAKNSLRPEYQNKHLSLRKKLNFVVKWKD